MMNKDCWAILREDLKAVEKSTNPVVRQRARCAARFLQDAAQTQDPAAASQLMEQAEVELTWAQRWA